MIKEYGGGSRENMPCVSHLETGDFSEQLKNPLFEVLSTP